LQPERSECLTSGIERPAAARVHPGFRGLASRKSWTRRSRRAGPMGARSPRLLTRPDALPTQARSRGSTRARCALRLRCRQRPCVAPLPLRTT